MLCDFNSISPVWIRYCNTEINMESIECNGMYEHKLIISGKKRQYLFNLLSSCCAAWCLAYSSKKKLIGAKLSKLG